MAKDSSHFKKERLGGSLVTRVIIICLALLIFPLILHSFFFYHHNYKEIIEARLRDISIIGKSSQIDFSEWLLFNERSIKTISFHKHLQVGYYKKLAKHLKLVSLFILVKQPDGQYVCTNASNEKRIGQKNIFSDELSSISENEPKVFAAYDPLSQTNQIFIAVAVRENEIYVLGKAAMSWINRFSEAFHEYFDYWLTFVDDQGNVIATNDPYYTPKGAQFFSLKDLEERRPAFLTTKQHFFILDIPFSNTNFSLNIGFSKMAIQQQTLNKLLKVVSVFCFLVFFVGGGMVWWLTTKMKRPLKALYRTMQEVGKGNLSARFTEQKWGFEINQLGRIFNHTVEDLVTNMKTAEAERLKSETYQKELSIAREIQNSLFPKRMPSFPSLEIATSYLPAKVVSGDFFDLFPLGDKLMIVIADASGKGVSSSLYSLSVRSLLRSSSTEFTSLEEIVEATNQLFCLDTQDSGSFVTAWIGLYDRKTKHLQFTSCGHNPIFLRRPNGQIEELVTGGMALGVSPTEKIKVCELQLEVGDNILLYTDGLVEAQNPENEFYGKARVLELIDSQSLLPPNEFLDKMLSNLEDFTKGAEQFDDITLLALQIVST